MRGRKRDRMKFGDNDGRTARRRGSKVDAAVEG